MILMNGISLYDQFKSEGDYLASWIVGGPIFALLVAVCSAALEKDSPIQDTPSTSSL